jgi:SAM-dependent methyltransferase
MTMTQLGERCDAVYRSRFAGGDSGWHGSATAAEIRSLLQELLSHTGAGGGAALELGCGTGPLSRALAEAGFDVLGLDISPVAIERARRTQESVVADWSGAVAAAGTTAGPGAGIGPGPGTGTGTGTGIGTGIGTGPARRGSCVFEVHDITLPRPDLAGRFNIVLDGLVLHCVTDKAARARAVELAGRALRPGGALLVMTVCGDPRRLPPGSAFVPETRCLMTGATAEAYYTTPAELEALFAAEGLAPARRQVVSGAEAGEPDLYLAVLRHAGSGTTTSTTDNA